MRNNAAAVALYAVGINRDLVQAAHNMGGIEQIQRKTIGLFDADPELWEILKSNWIRSLNNRTALHRQTMPNKNNKSAKNPSAEIEVGGLYERIREIRALTSRSFCSNCAKDSALLPASRA